MICILREIFLCLIVNFFSCNSHQFSWSGVEDTLRCIVFYKNKMLSVDIYVYWYISLYICVYIYVYVYIYIYVTNIYVEYTVHIHPLLNLYRPYINIKWPHLFACVCPRKGGLDCFWMSAAVTLKDAISSFIYFFPSRLYQDKL